LPRHVRRSELRSRHVARGERPSREKLMSGSLLLLARTNVAFQVSSSTHSIDSIDDKNLLKVLALRSVPNGLRRVLTRDLLGCPLKKRQSGVVRESTTAESSGAFTSSSTGHGLASSCTSLDAPVDFGDGRQRQVHILRILDVSKVDLDQIPRTTVEY
jgi:hypothetical protein